MKIIIHQLKHKLTKIRYESIIIDKYRYINQIFNIKASFNYSSIATNSINIIKNNDVDSSLISKKNVEFYNECVNIKASSENRLDDSDTDLKIISYIQGLKKFPNYNQFFKFIKKKQGRITIDGYHNKSKEEIDQTYVNVSNQLFNASKSTINSFDSLILCKQLEYKQLKFIYFYIKEHNVKLAGSTYYKLAHQALRIKDFSFFYKLLMDQFYDGNLLDEKQLESFNLLPPADRSFIYQTIGLNLFKSVNNYLITSFITNCTIKNLENVTIYNELKDSINLPSNVSKNRLLHLIKFSIKACDVNQVEMYYNIAIKQKESIDETLYVSLFKIYSLGGYGKKANKIWSLIPKNHPAYASTASLALDNCYLYLDLQTLNETFEQIRHHTHIETNHYTSYLEGLVQFQQYEKATEIFIKDLCIDRICKPNPKTFQKLVVSIKTIAVRNDDRNLLHLVKRILVAYKLYLQSNPSH
ncbi:hypothetical protein K502DRAFT_163879 [Neoconidiobolus thromboides FSU 785]|nr:hypothetical protein K502DRAFT_163879 [Neoconidiobolus thromboides FSU 785]